MTRSEVQKKEKTLIVWTQDLEDAFKKNNKKQPIQNYITSTF